MYRRHLLFAIALSFCGCCQFDDDCIQRQLTEDQFDEVRAGKRDSLINPHPELIGDFAREKAGADKIHTIVIMDDARSPHFASLTEFPNLRHLRIYEALGANECVKYLSHAENLTRLELEETDISDSGLESIYAMPALERLDLFGTRGKLSVEAIKNLGVIPTLRSLYLNLSLSETELQDIRESLPNIELEIE